MLQFAVPLGLLALGTLVVPVLIHLVRRPMREVRVGSLRFIPADRASVRMPRWRELLLLLLRCGLFALLALALAGMRWQRAASGSVQWALVLPNAAWDDANVIEWDRLAAQGFERRVLAPGFPLWRQGNVGHEQRVDVWSLLREVDARVGAGSRAVVFGPAKAENFIGERPTLKRLTTTWHLTPSIPEIERAPRVGSVRIAIVAAAERTEDARFVRAAMRAISGVEEVKSEADWVFQLGDVVVPNQLAKPAAIIVTDAPQTSAVTAINRLVAAQSGTFRLRQRVKVGAGAGLLFDSAGDAVAVVARRGEGQWWRFGIRFHPQWTDWVLSSDFPAWWQSELRPHSEAANEISIETAAPALESGGELSEPTLRSSAIVDLQPACWLIAVLLFVMERIVSSRARRGVVT